MMNAWHRGKATRESGQTGVIFHPGAFASLAAERCGGYDRENQTTHFL
jgi:hypothetical protein